MIARCITGLLLALLVGVAPAAAEVTVSFGWERPIVLQVVDAASHQPVPHPLLVVIRERGYPGVPESGRLIEVLRGDAQGRVETHASERASGAELAVTAPGYGLLLKRVHWKDLPPRRRDGQGFDLPPAPRLGVALTDLRPGGAWRREFKLTIGPALEEFLQAPAVELGKAHRRLLADYLAREQNRMLGLEPAP